MIGTLGKNLVFEVSDEKAFTFTALSREVSGRWTEHMVMGEKPKAEFLGPGLQTGTLEITLSAAMGVKPRAMLETIEAMVESGAVEYLVIGGKTVGKNPFRLMSSSEAWNTIYSRGELAKATLTLKLGEYT